MSITPQKNSKSKISIKWMLILQMVVLLYTTSSIFMNFAKGFKPFSLQMILLMGGAVFVLGIYAILWQQIIKNIDLSFAYANRSIALLWSMLWAFLIFGEKITPQNIIGVIIVIVGTVIVNSDHD